MEATQFFDALLKIYEGYDWLNHDILREDTLLTFGTILDDSEIIPFRVDVEVDEENIIMNSG